MAAQDVLKKLLASKMKGANPQMAQAMLAKMKGGKPMPKGGGKAVPGIVGKSVQAMPAKGIPQGGKIVKPNPKAATIATPKAAMALKKKRR